MEEKRLAYRMYFFVPYNISPIQQAIQPGHAALEYAMKHFENSDFQNYATYDKTWIILNGGTTRSIPEDPGTMQELLNEIFVFNQQRVETRVNHAVFHEPDLNNAMTAICFLADERVWDYKTYPEFFDFIINKMYPEAAEQIPPQNFLMLKKQSLENLKGMFPEYFIEWKAFLGGEKNLFLRELLKGKKLA